MQTSGLRKLVAGERVMELAVPFVPSVKTVCADCGAEIWIDEKNMVYNGPFVCLHCVLSYIPL